MWRAAVAFPAVVVGLAVLTTLSPGLARAQGGPFGAGELVIQGSSLTLYADATTTDAHQVLNVGERGRVRTCFGGVGSACGSVLPGDPRIHGLEVHGELSGPELASPLQLVTVPGGSFLPPGFQQQGTYLLSNIRLVEAGSARVLGLASPSVAVLEVREILLASATVRTLSLEELRARGIAIGAENFQAFNFAVGFAIGEEIVEFELPLAYFGHGAVQPLRKATVILEGLPPATRAAVERWKPPHIVPFRLEVPERDLLESRQGEEPELEFPVFGAIVVPGTVTYLNQFFEAQVVVANGAPIGTPTALSELSGTLRLPGGNVLRVSATDPPVTPGQGVPILRGDGMRVLHPGQQGAAAWVLEGLRPGTHLVEVEIGGELTRPGKDPLPVRSHVRAAVEVVDARFNLTFSHPEVVREAEAYSLFVTVTNLSRVAQNLITVEIRPEHMTGAHREDPNDDLRRTLETLEPGGSETLEYRLVSELTGKVVATTFQASSSSGEGTIRLRTGVGELGIPLSPATLIMPRFSELLAPPNLPNSDLFKEQVRFLGLAYSLGVAPSAMVPPGLPDVVADDVEQRAIDLGEAGHRVFLGDDPLDSMFVWMLDRLGNRHALESLDELRRLSPRGRRVAAEIGALLRWAQTDQGLDAEELFDRLVDVVSYTPAHLLALSLPAGSDPPFDLVVRRRDGGAMPASELELVHDLPFGDAYLLDHQASTASLAVVGRVGSEVYDLVLENSSPLTRAGRMVVVVPDEVAGGFRRIEVGPITLPAGGRLAIPVGASEPWPSAGGSAPYDPDTGLPAAGVGAPNAWPVVLPAFRLVGSAQDFRINESGPDSFGNMKRPNRYGNGVTYLFNRPPAPEILETPEVFRLVASFVGLDFEDSPVTRAGEKRGDSVWLQTDERVLAVRYDTPVSPLIREDTTGPVVVYEQYLDGPVLDLHGMQLLGPVPPPRTESEPFHVGGLLEGRVLRGDGEGVVGAKVELIRPRLEETPFGTKVWRDLLGQATTGPGGEFFFDFIEWPHWDRQVARSVTLRAHVPAGPDPALQPATVQEVSTVIRRQNRLSRVNIALLGRGAIEGIVIYDDDGSPVPAGSVSATSTLFDDVRSTTVGPDGRFHIGGVVVGPVTLTATDSEFRRVFETLAIEGPGEVVSVTLRVPRIRTGVGTVRGVVTTTGNGGEPQPLGGATVQVFSRGGHIGSSTSTSDGEFHFDGVPAGQVTVQAAEWGISRTAAHTDLLLADGQDVFVELRITEASTRAVEGQVLFQDPYLGLIPVAGATALIGGPGVFAHSDSEGRYRIEGVPVQGLTDSSYQVTVIDFGRFLQVEVPIPPITDASPDVILAQPAVLRAMVGGVDGVVLDPLGRPFGGAEVALLPYQELVARADGSFSFDNIPVGSWPLFAHVGNGLEPGRIGYYGSATGRVVFGGHRPFVEVRMVGSGVVTLHTRTATSTGILTPIYYRLTEYVEGARQIQLSPEYIESSTDQNGLLQLLVPVGPYEIVAYNPFHGARTVKAQIDYPGQVRHHDVLFADAAAVFGRVVDVDGITPVPDILVSMTATGFQPQNQRAGADGTFRFELVPPGAVSVSAAGFVGNVERVGRTESRMVAGGADVEVVVRLKAQGSIRGQVRELTADGSAPLPFAQFVVSENSYPFRRLPSGTGWFTADVEGRYEVSRLFEGRFTVVARDSAQVTRQGSASGEITADWQIVDVDDVVLGTSVGRVEALIRDPQTGGPVADAVVSLSNGEVLVSGADGLVAFEALPLGSYWVYAFDAPTGRAGRVSGVVLSSPGQEREVTIYLDQRGEVHGTLFDDPALSFPVPGATVQLSGSTSAGALQALATTSGQVLTLGRFSFLGIPEGRFNLAAAAPTSTRRAYAEIELTETSPIANVNLVLEPVRDVWVRLYERLSEGVVPVDVDSGVYSVRLRQHCGQAGCRYNFTQSVAISDGLFFFPEAFRDLSAGLLAEEVSGEQRRISLSAPNLAGTIPGVAGSGAEADPYQLVLQPKAVVRVTVRDGSGVLAPGIPVTVRTSAGGPSFPSTTDSSGIVTFTAVPAGTITASAHSVVTGLGGVAQGLLQYDDQLLELNVTLAPAVSAVGTIYQPWPDDRPGDPATLVPAAGRIVIFRDSRNVTQILITGEDGRYRLDGLATGAFILDAQDNNGTETGRLTGTLVGPDGNINELPALVLDASPPRLLTISPPPGYEGVSRTATVEIVFSEPLANTVVPTGQPTSSYFSLRAAGGALATGSWSSYLDEVGRQVVRFVPSQPYLNFTTYSLVIKGGPSGVRDRIGRLLTSTGDVGTNFTTSDSIGPTVIGAVPTLGLPVDPRVAIRVDFSERVTAPPGTLDGDFIDDAAELWWEADVDGQLVWNLLPVSLYLTRGDFSLGLVQPQGLELEGDTLRRRLVVSRLLDAQGNEMEEWIGTFRIWDANAPQLVEVPYPANAPSGDLGQGQSYSLVPVVADLDDVTPELPGGDLERVDYFLSDPEQLGSPVSPSFSARTHPFSWSFVAAYTGNGIDPRPFPVWVRAVDTSTNESEVVQVLLRVLPNAPPLIGLVEVVATAPVAGVAHAGSTLLATVSGVDDQDALQLTLSAELWAPDGGGLLASRPGRLLVRPNSGSWLDLPPQTFDFALPTSLAEGTPFFVRARLIDSQGTAGVRESATEPVADDATAPELEGLVARLVADGSARSRFLIGEELRFEVLARDLETAVQEVVLSIEPEGILPSPLVASRVSPTSELFRTAVVRVEADLFSEPTWLTATATASDWGGNAGSLELEVEVTPAPDPTAPVASWITPWEGAGWPASYSSVIGSGVPFLLRASVHDTSLDEDGNPIPGTIVAVTFRGPVRGPGGELELASDWTGAVLVAGSGGPGTGQYETAWTVPNDVPAGTSLPFEVRAVDSGGLATVERVRLSAVPPRRVYEGVVTAVTPSDPMSWPEGDPAGPVFLLDGTTLSVFPQGEGAVRSLSSVYLWAGASSTGSTVTVRPSVLTAPEITSYNSAILFHPFELEIEELLGVGGSCRIDLSGRGLLGSTTTQAMVLPGERGAGRLAGGSHGGSGWFGSPLGGWNREDLQLPGSVYGNLRAPALPGGGGGSNSSSTPGGAGGGVVRIFAPNATVRLVGNLLADGGQGSGGGGAGGSIHLVAQRLEGAGVISARGGNGTAASSTGGGGGGRISLSWAELGPWTDPVSQSDIRGGHNNHNNPNAAQRLAGAGTLVLEDRASGEPVQLVVANRSGLPSAATPLPGLGDTRVVAVDAAVGLVTVIEGSRTGNVVGDRLIVRDQDGLELAALVIDSQERVVFEGEPGLALGLEASPALEDLELRLTLGETLRAHGRARFTGVAATGRVRLVTDDDLELGPLGTEVLNDRTQLLLDTEARALLRGEAPALTLSVGPEGGGELFVGSSIEASWSASDPFGLRRVEVRWPFADPTITSWSDERLAASAGPLSRSVPTSSQAGEVALEVIATDTAGRVTVASATWTVIANEAPSGAIEVDEGLPAEVKAGYSISVRATALDREGLTSLTFLVTGPGGPTERTVPLSGTSTSTIFAIDADVDADGSSPIEVLARITDSTGVVTEVGPLVIAVIANEPPVLTLAMANGEPAELRAGYSGRIAVSAHDPDELSELAVRVAGEGGPTERIFPLTESDVALELVVAADPTATEPLVVSATARDRFGVSANADSLSILVIPNEPPTALLRLAAGAPPAIKPNRSTEVVVEASDFDGIARIEFEALGPVTEPLQVIELDPALTPLEQSFTVTATPTAPQGPIELLARAYDRFGLVVATNSVIVEVVGDQLPTGSLARPEWGEAEVLPGSWIPVVVDAADEEQLSLVVLRAEGPVSPETSVQFVDVSGTTASLSLYVDALRTATPDQVVTVWAEIHDSYGNPPFVTESLITTILPDLEPPELTVTNVLPHYFSGERVEPVIEVSENVGTASVVVDFDGQSWPLEADDGFELSILVDPELVGNRQTSLVVTATDFHNNVAVVSIPVEIREDLPPAVTLTIDEGPAVMQGGVFTARLAAVDDLSVETVHFELFHNGTLLDDTIRRFGGPAARELYRRVMSKELAVGEVLVVRATVVDRAGHVVEREVSVVVAPDSIAPEVEITAGEVGQPATWCCGPAKSGIAVAPGAELEIVVAALDNVGVDHSTLWIDGALWTEAEDPLIVHWVAPEVEEPLEVTLYAEATDATGNVGSATLVLRVEPETDGSPGAVGPAVGFSCLSSGATLPAGLAIELGVWADGGGNTLDRVELYRDDEVTPFVVVTPDPEEPWGLGAEIAVTLPSTSEQTEVRYRAVAHDIEGQSASTELRLALVDAIELDPSEPIDWSALEDQVVVLRTGVVTLDQPVQLAGLILLGDAVLTHPPTPAGGHQAVDLDVSGPVYIGCDAGIEATGRGFPAATTYPGVLGGSSGAAGNHIGVGGGGLPGRTYGSSLWPFEAGAGGGGSTGERGGGVLRLTALSVGIDGRAVAYGQDASSCAHQPGAGGSVLLIASDVFGRGYVGAGGGAAAVDCPSRPGAGGGAIAIWSAAPPPSELSLNAGGGSASGSGVPGGSGSTFVADATNPFGVLATSYSSGQSVLASLGSGVAASGTEPGLLVTDLSAVPEYFAGHWVEVHSAAGELRGRWRITEVDGSTVSLEGGSAAIVQAGDYWAGLYRLDDYQAGSSVTMTDRLRFERSVELSGPVAASTVEVEGDLVVLGSLSTARVRAENLVVGSSGTIAPSLGSEGGDLSIVVPGSVEIRGSVSASGSGYGYGDGGSHIGLAATGSVASPAGSRRHDGYGSIVRPREAGEGGGSNGPLGGGAIEIRASAIRLDGSVTADGGSASACSASGAAGGSVLLETLRLQTSWSTWISARGGNARTGCTSSFAGGGGAVAIHAGNRLADDLLERVHADGGFNGPRGGAGTIYFSDPTTVFGKLAIRGGSQSGAGTALPEIGAGVVAPGSTGSLLVWGPAAPGAWLEVRGGPRGLVKGIWRVRSVATSGVELEAPLGGSVALEPGDTWRGIHRYDELELIGAGDVLVAEPDVEPSDGPEQPLEIGRDPLRIDGTVRVEESPSAGFEWLRAHTLRVGAGVSLGHPRCPYYTFWPPDLPPPEDEGSCFGLFLDLTGDLVLESSASIDATGRGYGPERSYLAEPVATGVSGASHLGKGGGTSPSTYGSVEFPLEAGAGGATSNGTWGGGIVRIDARDVVLEATSAIRASGVNGTSCSHRGGAGGSIWLSARRLLAGDGSIEAHGGRGGSCANNPSGGGGAIAIDFTATSGSVLQNLRTYGGDRNQRGGAGTILTRGPGAVFGDLLVDNNNLASAGATVLPPIGGGTAGDWSEGRLIDTELDFDPWSRPYATGRWIELRRPDGTLKGLWRAGLIDWGIALEDGPWGVPEVEPGDLWQAVWPFDSVTIRRNGILESADPVYSGSIPPARSPDEEIEER